MMTKFSKIYRHVKTSNLYVIVCHGKVESNLEGVVIYKSLNSDDVFVRPSSEFYDGRFEWIKMVDVCVCDLNELTLNYHSTRKD